PVIGGNVAGDMHRPRPSLREKSPEIPFGRTERHGRKPAPALRAKVDAEMASAHRADVGNAVARHDEQRLRMSGTVGAGLLDLLHQAERDAFRRNSRVDKQTLLVTQA